MATLAFWYDFASTYSYLSAMRIEALAEARGIEVEWRPFLLGPIFTGQGWTTSPFNIYKAKGAYMWRDMERLCAARGLAFQRPDRFPQNGLHAARLALIGADEGWIAPFTRAIFQAEFAAGAMIASETVLGDSLTALGLDASDYLNRIRDQEIKNRLKRQTSEAMALGIFGAPSFVVGRELYWGDDRLEQALEAVLG